MKIKIIKDCENGMKSGDIKNNIADSVAKELIRLKIAEEVKTRKPSTKKEK